MSTNSSSGEVRQSKKRKKAIAITDIAIQKVTKVKFDGFSECENDLIWRFHRLLLRLAKELCDKRENNGYEFGIIVNINTWEHIEITGTLGGVYIDSNREAKYALENGNKNSILYMHNHPSTGTFSATDIKTFLLNDAIFIMTAVGNDENASKYGLIYMKGGR